MRFINLLVLFLGLAIPSGAAGTFELGAQVSKDHVELGESFVLSLTIAIDGNFTFQPQLETPKLDGFELRSGPQQSSQVSWVNGVVKQQQVLQWELVAMKSGTLTIGPFKVSANDAAQGLVVKTAPAITITVAKGQGFVLPPTPTPEPDGALNPPPADEKLRDIKADLGFPWLRASILAFVLLLIAAVIVWFALRPPKPKKIEVVRDPGQVALVELEKARQLLIAGDEAGYYKELARIIRFYLRHRMRTPEKELTLFEAELVMQKALLKSGEENAREGSEALERLQELLFANSKPQAQDADTMAPALRKSILTLEKDATWNEEDLVKAELDRVAEKMAGGEPELYFQAMLKAFKIYLSRQEERWGKEILQERVAAALNELGPAATNRVGYVLLSKRLREDLDLEKLNKDLQRVAEHLEKGDIHGKRK